MEKLLPPQAAHASSTLIGGVFLALFPVPLQHLLGFVYEPLRFLNAAPERGLIFLDFVGLALLHLVLLSLVPHLFLSLFVAQRTIFEGPAARQEPLFAFQPPLYRRDRVADLIDGALKIFA